MKPEQIMQAIESYYGLKYQGIEKTMVIGMLEESGADEETLKKIFISHSKQFRSLPDIAILSTVTAGSKEDLRQDAMQAWEWLIEVANSYRCPVFEDKRIQYAIKVTGGWIKFCTHDIYSRDAEFYRKDFIDAYINCDPECVKTVALRSNTDKIAFYGNREIIMKRIDQQNEEQAQIGSFQNLLTKVDI
jgi:hypothetical protein